MYCEQQCIIYWSVICCCLIVIGCNAVRYIGAKTENIYGIGTGQIWLDKTRCSGRESDIDECSHDVWGAHSCGHHEDVAISCTTGRFNVLYYSSELPAIIYHTPFLLLSPTLTDGPGYHPLKKN